ncbi:MAG: EutN/CcmL family microcompartment protein [Planctomycetota bacterium]|jgi:ethanolamine utilization protein EutN|nr:EutN/CcmL family microcompartment protein [Planctomycetota bacterium]
MPKLAKVIGNIWGSRIYEDLEGASILLVQPINADGSLDGRPFSAVDTIGAGPGECVLYVTSYEAVIPYPKDLVPIDASLIGIVESVHLEPEVGKK